MKQGWEIKNLGEVCKIQGGSTPKRTESLFWENGTYPWFTVEDIREQGRIITDTRQKVTKVAWDKLRVFPKDTILLCCTASLGEYAITKIPLTSNQQFNGLVIKDKNYLSPMFLLHYCATLKNKLYSLSGKATIDFVSAEKVRQIPIPVPPLSEQENIVAELDCLSGIIENKKQQLKEYDALAQSIFYEMFGNPIDNEKGWETNSLGEIANISSGGTPSRKKTEYFTGNINWYSAGELNNLYLPDSIEKITEEAINNSAAKVFKANSLMVGMYDTAAFKLGILRKDSASNQACANIDLHSDNVVWMYYLLSLMKEEALKHRHGIRQKNLNVGFIKSFVVPIPPIALQQEFASKIEAIEKQKELIKQSIVETETLFNSRMEYYFN